jgi:hypothetical protein
VLENKASCFKRKFARSWSAIPVVAALHAQRYSGQKWHVSPVKRFGGVGLT